MSELPSLLISGGDQAAPYLTFGLSADPVSWIGLGVAGLLLVAGTRRKLRDRVERAPVELVLALLAALSCALSAAYLFHYLRGGPRIVDATSYFLEARGFAAGKVWFDVPEPRASFNGRFLLSSPEGLAVIFPPGYPLVLALGFVFGAPLAIGPVLAGLLVPATYGVARAFGAERSTAYAAAALGTASAALRYHTADTMSHGLSALLAAAVVALSVRESKSSALAAGACAGLLIATRPITGLVLLVLVAAGTRTSSARRLLAAVAVVPLLGFFLWHQQRLTGEWLRSGQSAYYAVADGPPGCFRYGFGSGIGCLFEHGDYVRARLADGYGFGAALGNTLRRLLVHCSDIANAAPLALGVPLGVFFARNRRTASLGAAVIGAVILGYAPFYFEGSYPGGGARFFADVLPLEHALIAIAGAHLLLLRHVLPLSLFGFSIHTSHQHEALARREGGRPMFEPSALSERGIDHGLLFVGTDHGFSLAHDPSASDPRSSVIAARSRGDALDYRLWDNLGRPPTFRYRYDPRAPAAVPVIDPYEPSPSLRIEAEGLYPPDRVSDGFTHPEVRLDACVSGRRVLRFRSTGGAPARAWLTLPALGPSGRSPSGRRVKVGWVDDAFPRAHVRFERVLPFEWLDSGAGPCRTAVLELVPPSSSTEPLLRLEIEATGGALDYVELLPPAASGPR